MILWALKHFNTLPFTDVSAVSVENNSSPKIKRKHIDLHKNSPKEIKPQKSVFHQFRKVSHVPSRDHGDDVMTSSSDNSLDTSEARSRRPPQVTRRLSPQSPGHRRSGDDLSSLNTVAQRPPPPHPVRAQPPKPSCGE